jgi:hypothetical protein
MKMMLVANAHGLKRPIDDAAVVSTRMEGSFGADPQKKDLSQGGSLYQGLAPVLKRPKGVSDEGNCNT